MCGNFCAELGVNLCDAAVGGNINCTYGTFSARQVDPVVRGKTTGRRLHCNSDMVDHCRCAFNGEGLHIGGNLLMSDTTVRGETRFTQAFIEKDLDAANGKFHHLEAHAICGDRMHVKGNIFFSDGFEAKGSLRLPRATIETDLSFFGSKLQICGKQSRSLYCEGAKVNGTVYLNNIIVKNGYVDFSYSSIGGNFNCTNSSFLETGDYALKARGMNIGGSVFMCSEDDAALPEVTNFQALSLVCLTGTKIDMDLICKNAHFENNKKNILEDSYEALLINNMTIDGKVVLSGKKFQAIGGINLDYTRIGSYLDCEDATCIAPQTEEKKHSFAFAGGKLIVNGSIYLDDGFNAKGTVMLNEAQIGRNLVLNKGRITNGNNISLWGNQRKIAGCIFMEEFTSAGKICLDNACVGGSLLCRNSELKNGSPTDTKNFPVDDKAKDGPYALSAEGIKMGGHAKFEHLDVAGVVSFLHAEIKMKLVWKKITKQPNFSLFLAGANIGVLDDEPESWPEHGNLRISDFKYNYIEDLKPENIKKRYTRWLRLTRYFRPQPYVQLAEVLKKCGLEDEAKEVMIEKNKRGRSQSHFSKFLKFIHGLLVGYGYKPGRAAKYGFFFILIGWGIFFGAFKNNLMVPLDSKNGVGNLYQIAKLSDNGVDTSSGFGMYSLVYSIDTFIPIINFQASSYWLPTAYLKNSNKEVSSLGCFVCIYRWIHIFMGWLISSMFIVALGRFSQK
jgi:hypothetical protein